MASINGVEVKNLNHFKGHEGETCLQGNVYLNGKKLGFWSQDSWGGPDLFEFDETLLDEARLQFGEGFEETYEHKRACDALEVFLVTAAWVKRLESEMNRTFRKGYSVTIFLTDGFHEFRLSIRDDDSDENLLKTYSEYVESMKNDLFQNEQPLMHIFRPGGFDFVVDKDHPAPEIFRR